MLRVYTAALGRLAAGTPLPHPTLPRCSVPPDTTSRPVPHSERTPTEPHTDRHRRAIRLWTDTGAAAGPTGMGLFPPAVTLSLPLLVASDVRQPPRTAFPGRSTVARGLCDSWLAFSPHDRSV